MMCSSGCGHGLCDGKSLKSFMHFLIAYGLHRLFKTILCRVYNFLLFHDINGLLGLHTAFLISYKYPLQSNLPDFDGWHSERASGLLRGLNGSVHSYPWLFAVFGAFLFTPQLHPMVCFLLLWALLAALCRMKVVCKYIFLFKEKTVVKMSDDP